MGSDHWTRTVDGGIRHCSLHRAFVPATIKYLSAVKSPLTATSVRGSARSPAIRMALPLGMPRVLQVPGRRPPEVIAESQKTVGVEEGIKTYCPPSLCGICSWLSRLARPLIISTACGIAPRTCSLSPISPSSRSRIAGSQPTRYRHLIWPPND
jgi:hypothetical protein